ncbi:DUF4394 domain-containing protein [Streptomyces aureocirculatus]|uniref:DUF4394 domain-containing protein n=1 Tax=Streptomyces aureocirculatus TaxID=67275 RepID=UPI00099BA13E|nr:DUF4394 domain-containing protein [Streptomyces aureocirculatus]
MNRTIRKRIMAAVAATSASVALLVAVPGSSAAVPDAPAAPGTPAAPSLRAFGITGDGTLMATFTTDRPNVLDWVRTVNGLSGDQRLVGIDFRVQNGLLYGVGDKGGIYTIKTPPEVPDVVVTKVSQLQVDLYGTNFGVDFNPAADRLRVVGDRGQNLRHNLADHSTVEDTVLTTPPLTGPTRGVTAAAYTNNDHNGTTATTLFDINTTADQVVIQSPANSGFLAPTGSLTLDAGADSGLDVFSHLTNGKTTANSAFASLTPSGARTPSLYGVNLFTGEATSIAQFPLNITDLAITLTGN